MTWKQLFIIIYTTINTYPMPCDWWGCGVNHGTITDTTTVEVITFDTLKVSNILLDYPEAIVDTMYVLKKIK